MEVVRAFNDNKVGTQITILGTPTEPLFRLNDIGAVLELSNIHATIKDFDESQKVLNTIETLGGKQQVAFLTEFGLYEVLFRSRKPIAKKFKKWVCEVIKEIRLKGQYKLEKEKEELQDKLQEAHKTIETKEEENQEIKDDCERTIVRTYDKQPLVYVAYICNGEIKFGYTYDIKQRRIDHRTDFGPEFKLLYVFPTQKCILLETLMKRDEKIKKRIFSKEVNGKIQTELIKVDETGGKFTLKSLENCIKRLLLEVERDNESEIEVLRNICRENGISVPRTVDSSNTNVIPLTKPTPIKNVINGRCNGKVISRDLVTGEEKVYDSVNSVKSSIEGKAFKSKILDQKRQVDGKHWRSFGQPYWIPPMKFNYVEGFAKNFKGYIVATSSETKENVLYESPVEAAKYNKWNDTVRRKITEIIRKSSKEIYKGFIWSRLPRDKWGSMQYSKLDSETLIDSFPTPRFDYNDIESLEDKVKKLFIFTDSELDTVTIKDLKWILKTHVPQMTFRQIGPYFINWGAEKCEISKKIKSIVDKIPGVYYKKVKYIGNLEEEINAV